MIANIGCPSYRRLMSRRDVFRVGGAGLFGLSMSSILAAQAKAAKVGGRPAQAKQMIVLWQGGGPPHTDMYDMKPDAPDNIRGAWKPIQSKQPGLLMNELMPELAKVADKFTILRSACNKKGYFDTHVEAGSWATLSGNDRRYIGTPHYPVIGNVMSKLGRGPSDVPAYLTLESDASNNPKTYGSYLGPAHDGMHLRLGKGGDNGRKLLDMLTPPPAQLDLPTLERRTEMLRALDAQRQNFDAADALIAAQDNATQKAFDILTSPTLRQALDLKREPEKSAQRYGRSEWAPRVLAARRLIEAGASCVFVNISGWDFHYGSGGDSTYKHASGQFAKFSAVCAALLEDLDERGLLDQTIVLAGGEMGRTPKAERDGRGARGHWPNAMAYLLAGGGFRRGHIVGATDKYGAEVTNLPYEAPSLARTFYHLLGIDADQEFHTPDGRPLKIVTQDAPVITEALA